MTLTNQQRNTTTLDNRDRQFPFDAILAEDGAVLMAEDGVIITDETTVIESQARSAATLSNQAKS